MGIQSDLGTISQIFTGEIDMEFILTFVILPKLFIMLMEYMGEM